MSDYQAVLVLEDGSRFEGRPYGAPGVALGEAVFATGMTGYQETLTDPSYAGQIVVMTMPHIGVTGVNEEDAESERLWVEGFVVRDPSRTVSNHRATGGLEERLLADRVVGIAGVDTRAVTRRLRDAGAMRAGIFSGGDASRDPDEQLSTVRAAAEMTGQNLSDRVSTERRYAVQAEGERIGRVAVVDLGVKRSTLEYLTARGLEAHVLPAASTFEDIEAVRPDAVFYSNGPGDPAASADLVEVLRAVLRAGYPFFGICFGNQLLGRALGYETYKLPFGHRGINQPVIDRDSGRTEITAHNHGFAVDAPTDRLSDSPAGFGRVEVTHVNLNDQVVEGLRALDIPAFSVQYHPEAAAGPHDANYLFDRFRELIIARRERSSEDERSASDA